MELVQWIVPGVDGALRVRWAPLAAECLSSGGPLLRRGTPLVSSWLAHPICVSALEDAVFNDARVIVQTGALSLAFAIALDVPSADAPVPSDADDVRFAGVFGELVRVLADLCESAGLSPTSIAPLPPCRGLQVEVDPVHGTIGALADAIILVRAAFELCAHARGLKIVEARVRCAEQSALADGRTALFLASVLSPAQGA